MKDKILIETSARHLHISNEHLEILFGKGAVLTHIKELSQPRQYACAERVTIVGPKKELKGVTILAPTRSATQVELSATDARSVGINAPIRESGDIKGSGGCKIIGPMGEVTIEEGVIVAKTHIHTNAEGAAELGVKDKERVNVRVKTDNRSIIFEDVLIRVDPNFRSSMHLDTDEANAAGCSGEVFGEIVR